MGLLTARQGYKYLEVAKRKDPSIKFYLYLGIKQLENISELWIRKYKIRKFFLKHYKKCRKLYEGIDTEKDHLDNITLEVFGLKNALTWVGTTLVSTRVPIQPEKRRQFYKKHSLYFRKIGIRRDKVLSRDMSWVNACNARSVMYYLQKCLLDNAGGGDFYSNEKFKELQEMLKKAMF